MKCAEVQEMLPAHEGGDETLTIRRHLAECADCRAELGRYSALRATMAGMQRSDRDAPPGLFSALVAIPETQTSPASVVRSHIADHRKVYAGGVAALAGAGAVALWRARRSRLATA